MLVTTNEVSNHHRNQTPLDKLISVVSVEESAIVVAGFFPINGIHPRHDDDDGYINNQNLPQTNYV